MITAKSDTMAFLEQMDGPLTVARMVVSTRQCDGFTRASMARKLSVTPQYLCDVEKGRRTISPATAYQWGERLGYSGVVWLKVAAEDCLRRDLAKVGQDLDSLAIEIHPRVA